MSQIKYAVSDPAVGDDAISEFHDASWKQDDIFFFCNSGEITKDDLVKKKPATCFVSSVTVCAIKCLVVIAAAQQCLYAVLFSPSLSAHHL